MKKRKKKRKAQYSKKQFVNIICSKCGLCTMQTKNKASFCYEMYTHNTDTFMSTLFPKLCTIQNWFYLDRIKATQIFNVVFCENCFLNKNKSFCPNLTNCFTAFDQQIDPIIVGNHNLNLMPFSKKQLKKFKKKKASTKYICEAYPTEFHNNNSEWETFINDTINENNTTEQNNT